MELEVVDVLQLEDPLQLVKDAEPADRFPMRLFLEKYIIPLLEVNYQHQNDPKLITLDDNQVGVIASRVLISNMFESLNNNKMTIAGFINGLMNKISGLFATLICQPMSYFLQM